MTLTQLNAIVVLAAERNFARAAEKCFITQPALTMQVQNLEQELGVKIFDRSKKPLIPTELGAVIIEQAQFVLQETQKISEFVKEFREEIGGQLRLGIIPTIAPYLVPRFINSFLKKYPLVQLSITEKLTETIIEQLKSNELDAGIFVTPWNDKAINVMPMFYEEFFVYVSPQHPLFKKKKLDFDDLLLEDVWLLDEGNCFRNQVINICHTTQQKRALPLRYQSGSIESLKKIVETRAGMTLIPELAIENISVGNKNMVKRFKYSTPVREVSLVTTRSFVKKRLIEKLKEEIIAHIPKKMLELKGRERVAVEL